MPRVTAEEAGIILAYAQSTPLPNQLVASVYADLRDRCYKVGYPDWPEVSKAMMDIAVKSTLNGCRPLVVLPMQTILEAWAEVVYDAAKKPDFKLEEFNRISKQFGVTRSELEKFS